MKDKIDRLVDLYLDGLIEASEEHGWRGVSMMGKAIDFLGYIPFANKPGSEDMAMIHKTMRMRRPHRRFKEVKVYLGRLKGFHQQALIAHRFCSRRPDASGHRITQERIAEALGLTLDQYKQAKKLAYRDMGAMVSLVAAVDRTRGQ